MNELLKEYFRQVTQAWNRFWFTSRDPATVCVMRILVGLMLVYTHLVWTLELPMFFSHAGVFPWEYQHQLAGGTSWAWSHFYWFDSPLWMWGTHFISILVLIAFTIGLCTRVTGILAFLIVVSYANRASGALFGLDQINGFLALYLAVAPCGMMYSVDAWLKRRRGATHSEMVKSTLATVATRLMQLHLCVVYLFAGLGKLQGITWWEGTAIWGAFASYEYQTIDMTWMVHLPWLVNIITLVSVFWEVSYAFLIWPRLTRPVFLLGAVLLHLGIGMCMGMMTFGLIMIVANMSFISPEIVRGWVALLGQRFNRSANASAESG